MADATRTRTPKDSAMVSLWRAWLAEQGLAETTRYNYVSRLRRALRVAEEGERSLLRGDSRDVRYVLGKIPPHPSVQNQMLQAMRLFYDYLMEQGLRSENPARDVKRAPVFKTLPRPLSVKECAQYLEGAKRVGPWAYALACLALYCGLRRHEIIKVRWADLYRVGERYFLDVLGKGKRVGRVPVHPDVLGAVERMRTEHHDPTWVFPGRYQGSHRSNQWAHQTHKRILKEAGLPGELKLHQLRHSFATWLRRTGVDVGVVQKAMRHECVQSTMIYMEVGEDEVADAVGRLAYGGAQRSGEAVVAEAASSD